MLKRGEPLGLSETALPGSYILDHLAPIGGTKLLPSVGEVPLDWEDILNYHLATGRLPNPQERITLKRLTDAYALGKYEGTDPLSISPANRNTEEDF